MTHITASPGHILYIHKLRVSLDNEEGNSLNHLLPCRTDKERCHLCGNQAMLCTTAPDANLRMNTTSRALWFANVQID